MIKGFRERQYQLAAQKRHEAYLKFNYYTQIAGYFDREYVITKQYNSWIAKGREANANHTSKKLKFEKLQLRREKLKKLLEQEEQQYKQDREELEKKKQKQKEQSLSLEALKQKLLEKRVEQSLYLPSVRRRYQSYFYNSDSLIDSSQQTSSATSRNCDSNYSQRSGNMSQQESTYFKDNSKISESLTTQRRHFNSNASQIGYNRRSLDDTNLRKENFTSTANEENHVTYQKECSEVQQSESPSHSFNEEHDEVDHSNNVHNDQNGSLKNIEEEPELIAENIETIEEIHDAKTKFQGAEDQKDCKSYKYFSRINDQNAKDDMEHWQNEKSLPWLRMGEERKQNLSIPMFQYLTHKNIKLQIQDLVKREMQACRARRWQEALRLRDMKNKLSLHQENHLLNAAGLEMDEVIRSGGLKSIEDRERLLKEREQTCTNNSSMYSEEAKEMWQKWVDEDAQLEKDQTSAQREMLMINLEEEWKNLALEDKNRVEHQYKQMTKSSLQEEYNCIRNIASNNRVHH